MIRALGLLRINDLEALILFISFRALFYTVLGDSRVPLVLLVTSIDLHAEYVVAGIGSIMIDLIYYTRNDVAVTILVVYEYHLVLPFVKI